MHKVDTDGNVSGQFTDGDPLIPTPATNIDEHWLNAVQGELVNAIEGLGGVLAKGTNNQLLTRLNAKYGRLDLANSWAAAQTFGASVVITGSNTLGVGGNTTVGGTLGVTGNTSLGGTLGVTATSTFSGPVNLNGATTVANGALSATAGATVTTGTANSAGLTSTGNGTGHGVVGLGGSNSRGGNFTGGPGNEGARVIAGTAATTTVGRNALGVVDGYIGFAAVNPNGNVPFQNTLTPGNISKAYGTIQTAGGNGTTTVAGQFNISSTTPPAAALNGALWVIRVTFAQPMASSAYTVTCGTDDAYTGSTTVRVFAKTTTHVDFTIRSSNGTQLGANTTDVRFDFHVIGAQ